LAPYSKERTLVPIEHEAGSALEPFRTGFFFLQKRKSFVPAGIRTADRPARC
jgi:hypothetical protein